MVEFNCDHESEGFCMFEGVCEYRFYIPHTKQWVCKEYCEQYIEKHGDPFEDYDVDAEVIDIHKPYMK